MQEKTTQRNIVKRGEISVALFCTCPQRGKKAPDEEAINERN